MKYIKLIAVSGLILASTVFTGTAEANWALSHGNNAVVEFPSNLVSNVVYKGWGLDATMKPNTINWYHIPVDLGCCSALRVNQIFIGDIFINNTDVKITSVHVYNGRIKVTGWDNLTITATGGIQNKYFSVPSSIVFNKGLSISIGVQSGSQAVSHQFALGSAGAYCVQY